MAGLADPEGPAGQRNAHLSPRHRILGHLSAVTLSLIALQSTAGQWMAQLLFCKGFLQ